MSAGHGCLCTHHTSVDSPHLALPSPPLRAGDSIRNMSDDMKRALGALKSDESKAAFEAGGGGKRAEALRTLAEAKANKQVKIIGINATHA